MLFDSSWNPSNDAQAIFRAWRYGQTRPVFVYRLLGAGTVEEKIYARQITKHGVTSGVCDDEQLARSFTNAELSDLWSLSNEPAQPTEDELDAPEVRPSFCRHLLATATLYNAHRLALRGNALLLLDDLRVETHLLNLSHALIRRD